jgi:hypothetical protein
VVFGNKRLVCAMWKAWRDTGMADYGYGPYNGTECGDKAAAGSHDKASG